MNITLIVGAIGLFILCHFICLAFLASALKSIDDRIKELIELCKPKD
jgi:ABC-type tungstate transport system substrate-binding protein